MKNKPKLTILKVINKSFISWGIKNKNNIPIYYKWNRKLQKINDIPFILVDFDFQIREWYITYIETNQKIFSSTVDDITGAIYIKNNIN